MDSVFNCTPALYTDISEYQKMLFNSKFNIFKLSLDNWASSLTTRSCSYFDEKFSLKTTRKLRERTTSENSKNWRLETEKEKRWKKLRKRLREKRLLTCPSECLPNMQPEGHFYTFTTRLQSKYWQKYHLRDRTNEIEPDRMKSNENERDRTICQLAALLARVSYLQFSF